jgi:hypothetical protein
MANISTHRLNTERNFSRASSSVGAVILSREKQIEVIAALCDGLGIRAAMGTFIADC